MLYILTCAAELMLSLGAGLVKLLRRCLTQMSSRTRSFIETCVKFERGARQQASSASLHCRQMCTSITL